jgi:hypothetical protein
MDKVQRIVCRRIVDGLVEAGDGLVELLAAIKEQRLVETVSFRRPQHAFGMCLFPFRVGQRQNTIVIEMDQPAFGARFREDRQRHRRRNPIVGVVVIAITTVGDAALESSPCVRFAFCRSRSPGGQMQETANDTNPR